MPTVMAATRRTAGRTSGSSSNCSQIAVRRPESISDPFYRVARNGHHIKPQDAARQLWLPGDINCCGTNQFALLAAIDREGGRCESAARPVTHFDKHEAAVGGHDQVDLTEPAAKVPRQCRQSVTRQEPLGKLLRIGT